MQVHALYICTPSALRQGRASGRPRVRPVGCVLCRVMYHRHRVARRVCGRRGPALTKSHACRAACDCEPSASVAQLTARARCLFARRLGAALVRRAANEPSRLGAREGQRGTRGARTPTRVFDHRVASARSSRQAGDGAWRAMDGGDRLESRGACTARVSSLRVGDRGRVAWRLLLPVGRGGRSHGVVGRGAARRRVA